VDAAAGVGAADDAGLAGDQIERVAAAGADDGQVRDDFVTKEVAVVAGGGGLDHLGGGGDIDDFGEGAEFEGHIHGGGLADGDAVGLGGELLKALGFNGYGVEAGLDGFKEVRTVVCGLRAERGIRTFIRQFDRGTSDSGGRGVEDRADESRGGALAESGAAENKQR